MASNYSYGYDQSTSLYSNYGYGGGGGGGASNQQVLPPGPTVSYGNTSNQSYGYGYYQQPQASQTNPTNYYTGFGSNVSQSVTTPTTSSPASSVSYPGYYQYSRSSSYSYQPQTGTNNPQTQSRGPGTSTYQSGTSSGSYPQSNSFQTGSYSYNTSYPQTGSYTAAAPTSSPFSKTTPTSGDGSFSSMTPQQQKVIRDYVVARGGGGAGRGGKGGQAAKNFLKKKTYENQQEFYCEVCKVGCGSSLTYKTHLEGKNHKKRLQQQQQANVDAASSSSSTSSGAKPLFKCDVCDVHCSNKDSYLAHIKGNKHTKTVALFRRLGKPLPPMTSVVMQEDGGVQVSGPRITFVGGKRLSSTGLTLEAAPEGAQVYPPGAPKPAVKEEMEAIPAVPDNETFNEVEPIGLTLVKSVKNDPKSPLSTYFCELCDCFFNDDLARIMHCKGRRHRLNYKRNIDPTLKVEMPKSQQQKKRREKVLLRRTSGGFSGRGGAPSGRGSGGAGRGGGGGGSGRKSEGNLNKLREEEASAIAALHYGRKGPDFYPPPLPHAEAYGGHDSWNADRVEIRNPADDKMIAGKCGQLYPTEAEIKATQKAVLDIEGALKSASDEFLMETCKLNASKAGGSTLTVKKDESLREIKGVMRVGLYAYNLLLKGRMEVHLVIMCAHHPTKNLLHELHDFLPSKLVPTAERTYHVTANYKKGEMMIVSTCGEVTVTVIISLTSNAINDDAASPQFTGQELNPTICLASLMALRQTNWYQANCQGLPSFSIVMRAFLDLLRRNTVWGVLHEWVLLILIHKCITSASPEFLRPGDIFRRVIECIASGVFLPGYPGVLDPCKGFGVDSAAGLTAQQRADLTLSAQHFLRLISFNQLHLILDTIPPPNYAPYVLRTPAGGFGYDGDEDYVEGGVGGGGWEGEGADYIGGGEGGGRGWEGEGAGFKRMKLDHL